MISYLSQAILKTLCYSDIFEYPLTAAEIWRGIIECSNVTMKQCSKVLKNSTSINHKDGLYFLKCREKIVDIRKRRQRIAPEKLAIARRIARIISLIPTVRFVGLTGALTVKNADNNDDIDYFIATVPGLVWTTRLLVTILLELLQVRRHPGDRNVKNKICPNIFVSENYLAVPDGQRNLYTAHEVVQLQPLADKGNIFQKFIHDNNWVKKYLPNVGKSIKYQISGIRYEKIIRILIILFQPLETILMYIQLWYMRSKWTREVVERDIIRFHPHDLTGWVLHKYKKRLLRYTP
jgi:hypothetical protein